MSLDIKALHKPEQAGVYIMKGPGGRILYVGKAKNLKSRVTQYFLGQDSRPFVPRMVREVEEIQFVVTRSEKEAFLLESQLVRKLKPAYNVRLQDDKNFLMVRADGKAAFPRIELVRKKAADGARYYGPYPSARVLREFVRFVSKAYGLRVCRDAVFRQRQRPCVLHGMGWCTGPCVLPDRNVDYFQRFEQAVELLTRRHHEAREQVGREMQRASDELRFEDAARYRDLLRAMDDLWSRQFVSVSSPMDADVFGVAQSPLGGTVYVLHVRDSMVVGTRWFFDEAWFAPLTVDLDSLIFQFYEGTEAPPLVVSRLTTAGTAVLRELLAERDGRQVRFSCPQRGDKLALLSMAESNAVETHRKEEQRALGRMELMEDLSKVLGLTFIPQVVECVDISSFQGGDAVGAVSVGRQGVMAPKEYRCFHVRGSTRDDFAMMLEVVKRRLAQVQSSGEPRLVILDGGRPQLRAIAPVLEDAALAGVHFVALAKGRHSGGENPESRIQNPEGDTGAPPGESGAPGGGETNVGRGEGVSPEPRCPSMANHRMESSDRLYLPGADTPVDLPEDSRTKLFLMALRDEAHRFAVAFHRKKRKARTLSSPLLSIPGVGKKRRLALVKHFGSIQALKAASLEQIQAVPGFPGNVAERVFRFLRSQADDNAPES